ncbi:hypothetical protein PS870_00494 [Pseudomonas fluorescens]|uniref:RHS repeat-associated core domain-containing protein n=1 Tax=Pseudomonas fluorescens TaxID=294 RepID=A0A5E7GT55_PSEFL|nr:RHS repeat-associated core domain-containing protein [Pseudomonas fluorescens]VVO55089.1 hypothetical protein PS870_00494 [Pseudomonas fluorescens]
MEDELEQLATDYLSSVLGFNGERIDPVLGGYHLGNGYRLYSPSLRRFTSPDSMSPFGKGGINPYAYCEGDPINNTDPTGHSIFGTLFMIGMALIPGGEEAEMAGGLIAKEGESIAAREVAQTGSKAIRSGEEAANIAKYGEPYPSQGKHNRANFKLFRPDAEGLRNPGRKNNIDGLADLMNEVGGYTDNFNGTGEPGLVVHGSYGVLIHNQYGVPQAQPTLDALKQIDRNHGLKLFQKTAIPLHILACRTSSPVLGAELATALERPIVLYGTDDELLSISTREILTGSNYTIRGNDNDPDILSENAKTIAAQRTYFPKF